MSNPVSGGKCCVSRDWLMFKTEVFDYLFARHNSSASIVYIRFRPNTLPKKQYMSLYCVEYSCSEHLSMIVCTCTSAHNKYGLVAKRIGSSALRIISW